MNNVIAKRRTPVGALDTTEMEIRDREDKIETFSQNPEEKSKRDYGAS